MVQTILSSNDDIRATSHSCSTTMAPPLPSSTNVMSSSTNIILEMHSPSKIN
jgi:hypothetical protein